MTFSKVLVAVTIGGAAMLTIAGCSTASTSNEPAGSLSASAAAPSTQAAATAVAPTFNSGGYLGGNAKPKLPTGDAGKVSVLSEGPLKSDGSGGASLLFTYRNNTNAAISHVDFTATATAGGKVVASGKSQGTIPAQVKPGEAGLGFIYFEDTKSIPDSGTTYAFESSTSPADTSSYNTAPLTVTQATNNGKSIIGSAANKTGKPLSGPYSVEIYCFKGSALKNQITDFTSESGDISAAASVSFSSDLLGKSCSRFTVGVSGYFK